MSSPAQRSVSTIKLWLDGQEEDTSAPSSLTCPTPTQGAFLDLAQALSNASSIHELRDALVPFLIHYAGARDVVLISSSPTDLNVVANANATVHSVDEMLNGVPESNGRHGYWIGFPMEYRSIAQGRMLVRFAPGAPPHHDAIDMMRLVAFTGASELCRLNDDRKIADQLADLNVIRALDREIARARDLQSMSGIVRDQISEAVPSTMCSLLVADDDVVFLEVVADRNVGRESRVGLKVPIHASRVGTVFLDGKPLVVGNILEDELAFDRETANWRSLMIAPLSTGERQFGALMVGHAEANVYDERDLRVVELVASQIANAIYRFLEEQREHEQHLAAIEALSAAVDARDPFTHTHSRRVADLAFIVAQEFGLDEREAREIELAGLLHDIGKIGIPDRILTKPGRLDTEERLIMMSHAAMGANIVGRSSALSHLTPIVRHHHEWYDGRGYPDGLRGDEIPLGASILAVVDALETMTSNRVYRRALPLDEARMEIERGRSSQFHPEITDIVLRLIDDNDRVIDLLTHAPETRPGAGYLAPIRSTDVVALRVLNRIGEEIGALTDLDLFLEHVHGILLEEFDIEDVVIWLHDDDAGRYHLAAGTSTLAPPASLVPLQTKSTAPNVGTSSLSPLLQRHDSDPRMPTVICPMHVEDILVGLIELMLHADDVVEESDIDLLHAIAAPVASTIRVAQLHDQAKRAARTDGLTGMLNHRAFYEELDRLISEGSSDEEIHLLIIDVVDLKSTNDNYGHVVGDAVLRRVAEELRHRLRSKDIVSRYGGDEFAVILQDRSGSSVETIVERLQQPVICELDNGTKLAIRLRCGHAVTTAGEGRATELVSRADSTLYERVRPTERGAA